MGMAEKNDTALVSSCFSSWLGLMAKAKNEKELRDQFEKEASEAERKLMMYREKQIQNIKAVLMRSAKGEQDGLLMMCWQSWRDEMNMRKQAGDTHAAMAAMEAKLNGYADAQKENTKKVMNRMIASNESGLCSMVFNGWLQFHQDYQTEKELEEAVREKERQVQAFMEKQKDDAKQVLARIGAGTDAGLVGSVFKEWARYIVDDKDSRAKADALAAQTAKFKSLSDRQKGNATGVQVRVNDQIKLNLMLQVWTAWVVASKTSRLERYYHHKIDGKKRQLGSVQTLFKSFAMQLEAGLSSLDGEVSSRSGTGKMKHSMAGKGAAGTVSLPDIHARVQ